MSEWGSEVCTVGETQQALSSLPLTGAPREARSFLLLCCCVPTHFHACLNTCQYFREWEKKNPTKTVITFLHRDSSDFKMLQDYDIANHLCDLCNFQS